MATLQQTLAALAPHGFGLCEHFVMCTVGYRGGNRPQGVAHQSWSGSAGDPRGEFPLAAHQAAVASCLAGGWLTVLTADDADREADRRRTSGLPELVDTGVAAGALDFTPVGFAAHRGVIGAVFGDALLDDQDAGWSHLEDQARFDLIAPTLDLCRRQLAELAEGLDLCVGQPAVVSAMSGPAAIGTWRPNRFVLRATGFRAGLTYRLAAGG